MLACAICAEPPRLRLFLQLRIRFASSMATSAASDPLLPLLPPARSIACCRVVGCEHAKRNRHAGIQAHSLQAFRRAAGDVIEMRRIASHHRPQRHDRVTARSQMFGRNRQFPGARYLHEANVLLQAAMLFENLQRAFGKLLGDELIETAHDNADTQAGSRPVNLGALDKT